MYKIKSKATKSSKKYDKITHEFMNVDEVVNYLKENNITVTEKPYIFTHLKLSDDRIITQDVCGMICSPLKLAEALNI